MPGSTDLKIENTLANTKHYKPLNHFICVMSATAARKISAEQQQKMSTKNITPTTMLPLDNLPAVGDG